MLNQGNSISAKIPPHIKGGIDALNETFRQAKVNGHQIFTGVVVNEVSPHDHTLRISAMINPSRVGPTDRNPSTLLRIRSFRDEAERIAKVTAYYAFSQLPGVDRIIVSLKRPAGRDGKSPVHRMAHVNRGRMHDAYTV